jgi:predicted amidohydrolase
VTPKGSLAGYDAGDRTARVGVPIRKGESIRRFDRLGEAEAVLVPGLAERGNDAVSFHAVVALKAGVVQHKRRKVYLATCGMFDEGRFRGRGAGATIGSPVYAQPLRRQTGRPGHWNGRNCSVWGRESLPGEKDS